MMGVLLAMGVFETQGAPAVTPATRYIVFGPVASREIVFSKGG